MRPTASESLYKERESIESQQDFFFPAAFAIRPLRLMDIDQVIALEETCFPPNERATPEKLSYRLTVCPELCVGVFDRVYEWSQADSPNSADADDEDVVGVASKRSTLVKETLVGHIIATKTNSDFVTDESMEVGAHREDGNTIAVHSVAVHPQWRHKHIGYLMVKDYVQKFFGLCTADGMALLAHEKVQPFYYKHGFTKHGTSKSQFGGETWIDMRLPFDQFDDQVEE